MELPMITKAVSRMFLHSVPEKYIALTDIQMVFFLKKKFNKKG